MIIFWETDRRIDSRIDPQINRHAAMRRCVDAKLQWCGDAALQCCEVAVMRRCVDAELQWCGDAALPWCGDAALQWCGYAAMRRCSDAAMRRCRDAALQWCGVFRWIDLPIDGWIDPFTLIDWFTLRADFLILVRRRMSSNKNMYMAIAFDISTTINSLITSKASDLAKVMHGTRVNIMLTCIHHGRMQGAIRYPIWHKTWLW